MITLLRTTATEINSKMQLIIKSISSRRTYTAPEYGPYGSDSRPTQNTAVAYSTTQIDGGEIIIGCLNKNRKAEIGEHRLFCTDKDGAYKFSLWLRADGTILIGDSDEPGDYTNFSVSYNELKSDLDALKQSYNLLVSAFNTHMHATAGTGPPSPPTPIPGSIPVDPNSTDFSNIKNEKIKTN